MRRCSDGPGLDHAATTGKRLLVISPHADDADLGCGGYMFRAGAAGSAVLNLVVAVGDVHFAHLKRVVGRAERMAELERSMAVLGAESRVLFTGHDRYLDTMPLADLVTALEVTISGFRQSPDRDRDPDPAAVLASGPRGGLSCCRRRLPAVEPDRLRAVDCSL